MPTRLREYQKILEITGFHAPIGEDLNLHFTHIQKGKARFELVVEKRHLNSIDVVQGGILTAMADAAMGLAFGSLVDKNRKFATMELKMSFMKPVMKGRLIAEGLVVKKGKRAGFAESAIYLNEISEKNLVSKSSSSLIVL